MLGDNNPRVFAETLSLGAWHSVSDDGAGVSDLFIDVAFAERGRVGGDPEPVRFRLSLRQAEVRIFTDVGRLLKIKRSSVWQPMETTITQECVSRRKETASASGALKLAVSEGTVDVGANVGAGTSSEREQTLTMKAESGKITVVPWNQDDGYSFRMSPMASADRLSGSPWARGARVLQFVDGKFDRKRGEPPSLRVEVRCSCEDLLIEDIEFVGQATLSWSALTRNKQVAVQQYIRDCLLKSGLVCGDLIENFADIVLADVVPEPD